MELIPFKYDEEADLLIVEVRNQIGNVIFEFKTLSIPEITRTVEKYLKNNRINKKQVTVVVIRRFKYHLN